MRVHYHYPRTRDSVVLAPSAINDATETSAELIELSDSAKRNALRPALFWTPLDTSHLANASAGSLPILHHTFSL